MNFMRNTFSQFVGLGVSACWLLCGQQVTAQGSTIAYTKLLNPSPGGLFPQEFGVPVYGRTRSGPFSVLPIDINQDGVVDYRVVAAGGCDGLNLEGIGTNAVWTRPTGGNDFGGFIRPLFDGTQIGDTLYETDEWMITWVTPWIPYVTVAPGFSAYCSLNLGPGIGLFRDMTAFAGLKFYIGTNAHFGWIRVQEIPWLGGGGIVHDFAYETRPNTPILAGAGIDSDNDGVWDLSDQCSDTSAGEAVDANGCSIRQLVPCDGPWKNHGKYVVRVVRAVADFRRQGLITAAEARTILREAAQSDCGKHPMPRPPHRGRIDRERENHAGDHTRTSRPR